MDLLTLSQEEIIRLLILTGVVIIIFFLNYLKKLLKERRTLTFEYLNHLAKTKSIDYAPVGIITINSSGLVVSWTKGAEDIFEYTEEEMLGKPLTIIMPERYRKAHNEGLERIRHTGKHTLIGRTVKLEGLRKNKKEFPVKLTLWQWREGPHTFYTGIVRDMSEDPPLSNKETLLLEVYKTAEKIDGFGVYHWDILKDIVTYSDGFKTLFNVSGEQLDSSSLIKHIHFEDKPIVDAALKKLFEEKRTSETEYRIVDLSGRTKKVRSKSHVNLDSTGEIQSVIGIIHEIKT